MLADEPSCKFMLKYDGQNYFRQLTKILSESLMFSEIKHAETGYSLVPNRRGVGIVGGVGVGVGGGGGL